MLLTLYYTLDFLYLNIVLLISKVNNRITSNQKQHKRYNSYVVLESSYLATCTLLFLI